MKSDFFDKSQPLFLTLFIANVAFPPLNAKDDAHGDVLSAFHAKWANSKDYLLEIADRMPAEHYDFKPAERQMAFRDQLLHIRRNMLNLSLTYLDESATFEDSVNKELSYTKAETIHLLKEAFDQVDAIVAKTDSDDLPTR